MRKRARAISLLRARILRLGWSQNELARRLGTDSAMVSRWLTGQRCPSLDMGLKIEQITGIRCSDWVELERTKTGTVG